MTARDLLNGLDYWTWLVLRPETGCEGVGTRLRGRDWLIGRDIPGSLFDYLDRDVCGLRIETCTDPGEGIGVPMIVATVKGKDNADPANNPTATVP